LSFLPHAIFTQQCNAMQKRAKNLFSNFLTRELLLTRKNGRIDQLLTAHNHIQNVTRLMISIRSRSL
jgi:hypothetical protein